MPSGPLGPRGAADPSSGLKERTAGRLRHTPDQLPPAAAGADLSAFGPERLKRLPLEAEFATVLPSPAVITIELL